MNSDSTTSGPLFLVAKTYHGLEPVLAEELRQIGAHQIEEQKRAVTFQGDMATLYRANMYLRTAIRILVQISEAQVRTEHDLYRSIYRLPWETHMKLGQTLAVDAVVGSHLFRHSHFVALKTKDAIVDRFRKKFNQRPSVDLKNPHLRVHINLQGDQLKILLDSSGESLHRRGYRTLQHPAPLSEVLAAGMILKAGWDQQSPLLDPMCGSGTLPIEAALISRNIAPGLVRKKFGFLKWPDLDKGLWQRVKNEALGKANKEIFDIRGRDLNSAFVQMSRRHADMAQVTDTLTFTSADFQEAAAPDTPGMLIVNPPYGERLTPEDLADFYKVIGDQLKQQYKGWQAWVLSSNIKALKKIGLRASRNIILFNGPLECRFA
ncbi:MAG: THUMP domain-containing protein, partial [Bacteroidota bacterium]